MKLLSSPPTLATARRPPTPDRRLLRTLPLAIALVLAGVAAVAHPAPAAAADLGPDATDVPACTVGDEPAPFRRLGQWRSTLLDTRFRLRRGYEPAHLVSTARAGLNGGYRIRRVVRDDLAAMARAARRAGVTLRVSSAYRSYRDQKALYDWFVERLGPEKAALRVARPGHSEHQLGTALDFANTDGAYAWLAGSSWRFGFILSYPKGERSVSCYRYEPWHVRYLGRPRAAEVRSSGEVLRAWLWLHVVDVAS